MALPWMHYEPWECWEISPPGAHGFKQKNWINLQLKQKSKWCIVYTHIYWISSLHCTSSPFVFNTSFWFHNIYHCTGSWWRKWLAIFSSIGVIQAIVPLKFERDTMTKHQPEDDWPDFQAYRRDLCVGGLNQNAILDENPTILAHITCVFNDSAVDCFMAD